jgi:hypothetical protein
MKKNLLGILAVTIFVNFNAAVWATPITGSISFIGGATVDTGNLGTATAFTGFSGLSVLGVPGAETGSYAGLTSAGNAGGTLAFSTFGFGGNVLSPSPTSLWTLTYLGVTYSFQATSVVIGTGQSSNFLNLSGMGVAHIDGFTDTTGSWSITDTSASGTGPIFTFGASSTALPDGGTTILLLGFAVSGLILFHKKLKPAINRI